MKRAQAKARILPWLSCMCRVAAMPENVATFSDTTPGYKWEFQTQRLAATSVLWCKKNIIPPSESSDSRHFWRGSRARSNFTRRWCTGVLSVRFRIWGSGVERFRGGLVFKAHRLLYHSNLGLRVIKEKKGLKVLPRP